MNTGNIVDMKGPVHGLPRERESVIGQRPMGTRPGRSGMRMGTHGRAWINGREVGGTDPRFRHLTGVYD